MDRWCGAAERLCPHDAGNVSMETWVSPFHSDSSALFLEAFINYYYLMNYSTAEGLEPSKGRVWLWSWPEVTVTASAMPEVEMTPGLTRHIIPGSLPILFYAVFNRTGKLKLPTECC